MLNLGGGSLKTPHAVIICQLHRDTMTKTMRIEMYRIYPLIIDDIPLYILPLTSVLVTLAFARVLPPLPCLSDKKTKHRHKIIPSVTEYNCSL